MTRHDDMDIKKVWCFIPVGGKATRLMPLTYYVSKPCVRFLNKPLIEFSMATLAKQGIKNFIFGELGYTNYTNLFDQYKEGIGFSAKYKIEPRVHIKHQPNLEDRGSADSYRLNMDYYDVRNPVLVVQGDNLFDLNIHDFLKTHNRKRAFATIGLTRITNVEEYGIAELDNDQRIRRFVEKPKLKEAPSNLANTGIYLFSPDVRRILNSIEVSNMLMVRERLDFGFDLIPYLVEKGYPVYGYELKSWFDVGNPEKYLKAMSDILHGKLDIRISEKSSIPGMNVWIQGHSNESIIRREEIVRKFHQNDLLIEGAALIGRHTRIGDYSIIKDTSIDNFCIIGKHVTLERSSIMDASKIEEFANISDSIIGRKSIVQSTEKNPTNIESTSVIGNTVHIREGCSLIRTKVNPGLIIPPGMKYVNKFLKDYEDVVRLAD